MRQVMRLKPHNARVTDANVADIGCSIEIDEDDAVQTGKKHETRTKNSDHRY